MEKIKAWLLTATTGQGAVALLATALAYAQGTIDSKMALVGLASGLALIVFPEKPSVAKASGLVVTDLQQALEIFSAGVAHGMSGRAALISTVGQVGPKVVQDGTALATAIVQPPQPTGVTA